MFGLNSIVFRPHNVYGERQNVGDRYRNVVGIFMNQILQGKPMTVFGDGRQTRAFSYIGDIAPIMVDAIGTPGAYNQTVNVGADQPFSILELAEAVARAMGVEPRVVHLPPRNEVVHVYASHQRVAAVFGARATCPLADGLARMAAWVRSHGARTSRTFEHVEIAKAFPAAWLQP
jgi:UDP-glucose 4-epimerase